MHPYDNFAKFYDATMGDRSRNADFVRTLIEKHAPGARTLLELACGTGSVLKHLARQYEVFGIDQSAQMLRIARTKLPNVELHRADMVAFNLDRTFDVIICVFDSMNHLLSFRAWTQVFRCAAKHLAKGGLFIFDVNMAPKLQRHIQEPAWVKTVDSGTVIVKVTDAGRGISNWNIKVFEHQRGPRYRLHEKNIRELSFPADRVLQALRRQFKKVSVLDPARSRPTLLSDRLYFICTGR